MDLRQSFCKELMVFRKRFVGQEISFSSRSSPIEMAWFSPSLQKQMKLSSLLYVYFSFTPHPRSWKEMPPYVTSEERFELSRIAECRTLVDEAINSDALIADSVLQTLTEANRLLDLWHRSIIERPPNHLL